MATKCLIESKSILSSLWWICLYYLHKQLHFDCNRETRKKSVTNIEGSDKLKRVIDFCIMLGIVVIDVFLI